MIHVITPEASQFLPDITMVLQEMGYCLPHNDFHLQALIKEKLTEIIFHTDIKAGYCILPAGSINVEKQIFYNGHTLFDPGSIIINQVKYSSSLALLLATLGESFDVWSKSLAKDDMLASYIADIIGSLMVERVIDNLESTIISVAAFRGVRCSNRFSPGYCQWLVQEQKQFFPLLPPEFNFVKLLDSCLMTPLKSISAIIGLGKNVKKGAYHCQICDLQNCYRKRKYLKKD